MTKRHYHQVRVVPATPATPPTGTLLTEDIRGQIAAQYMRYMIDHRISGHAAGDSGIARALIKKLESGNFKWDPLARTVEELKVRAKEYYAAGFGSQDSGYYSFLVWAAREWRLYDLSVSRPSAAAPAPTPKNAGISLDRINMLVIARAYAAHRSGFGAMPNPTMFLTTLETAIGVNSDFGWRTRVGTVKELESRATEFAQSAANATGDTYKKHPAYNLLTWIAGREGGIASLFVPRGLVTPPAAEARRPAGELPASPGRFNPRMPFG